MREMCAVRKCDCSKIHLRQSRLTSNAFISPCLGGSTLYIESSLTRPLDQSSDTKDTVSGGGHLHVTGHLGDVMKESAQIAHTVAKSFLSGVAPNNEFLHKAHIHVHVPEVGVVDILLFLVVNF